MKATDLKNALEKQDKPTKALTLSDMVDRPEYRKRFDEVLKQKAPAFISSVIAATKANATLMECPPASILSAAMVAATLDLPINPALGFAHIVPYFDKKARCKIAQFQIGWKGLVQLGARTGLYAAMNTSNVYEGELLEWDHIRGEFKYDLAAKKSNKTFGYVAYFRLTTGFEKWLYMPIEELLAHGKKYSQTFKMGFGNWVDNEEAMCMKTVLKLLLSKYGPMSTDLATALKFDQAAVKDKDGELEPIYVDNPETPAGELPAAEPKPMLEAPIESQEKK